MTVLNELLAACRKGDIDKVRQVLTSHDIDKNQYPMLLEEAVLGGQLEVVKFLTSSKDLAYHADIHANKDIALVNACRANRLNIVQYLLTSPDLSSHCNIHTLSDAPIREACISGYPELVQYLLDNYDLNINNNLYKIVLKLTEDEKKQKHINFKNPKALDDYQRVLKMLDHYREGKLVI